MPQTEIETRSPPDAHEKLSDVITDPRKRKMVEAAEENLLELARSPEFQDLSSRNHQNDLAKKTGLVFEVLAKYDPNLPKNSDRLSRWTERFILNGLREKSYLNPDAIIFRREGKNLVVTQIVEIKLGARYREREVVRQMRAAVGGVYAFCKDVDRKRDSLIFNRLVASLELDKRGQVLLSLFLPADSASPDLSALRNPHRVIRSIFTKEELTAVTRVLVKFNRQQSPA